MKKKSILGRIGIVAAALTLATTSMMSGTLARYQTAADIKATAIAAKWNATVKDSTESTTLDGTQDIVLADTMVKTSSTVNTDLIGNNAGKARIAPGTAGEYTFVVSTEGSEVPALFKMSVKQDSTKENMTLPKNVEVKIYDNDDMKNPIGTFTADDINSNGTTVVGGSTPAVRFASAKELKTNTSYVQKKIYTIKWSWPLNAEDGDKNNGAGDTLTTNDINSAGEEYGFVISYSLIQHDGNGEENKDFKTAVKKTTGDN